MRDSWFSYIAVEAPERSAATSGANRFLMSNTEAAELKINH
jgi:hypothetical protein